MTGRRAAVLSIESTSVQDYVKAIYTATEWQDDAVTATYLAGRLGVANSSVTGMVAKLVGLGLAEHRKYGPIALTPSGRVLALAMVRRHRLIETFLVTELGYGWDEVHDEAELLEHTVSDAFVERLDTRLDRPARDPHGDPVPASDGSVRYPRALRLDALDDGHTGPLVRVSDDDPAVLRLLDRHGISLDDELMVERSPRGGISVRRVHPAGTGLPDTAPPGVAPAATSDRATADIPDPAAPDRATAVVTAPRLDLAASVPRALWIGVGVEHVGCVLTPTRDPSP